MKDRVCFVLGATAIAAALLIAGQADYEEALASQRRYCEMVAAGHWPDFNGDYETVCLRDQ